MFVIDDTVVNTVMVNLLDQYVNKYTPTHIRYFPNKGGLVDKLCYCVEAKMQLKVKTLLFIFLNNESNFSGLLQPLICKPLCNGSNGIHQVIDFS